MDIDLSLKQIQIYSELLRQLQEFEKLIYSTTPLIIYASPKEDYQHFKVDRIYEFKLCLNSNGYYHTYVKDDEEFSLLFTKELFNIITEMPLTAEQYNSTVWCQYGEDAYWRN